MLATFGGSDLNWKPRVGWQQGVGIVHEWVRAHSQQCVRSSGVSANAGATNIDRRKVKNRNIRGTLRDRSALPPDCASNNP